MTEMKRYTKAGTDIDEVKRLNANSGLSYNEVKALIAKEMGGRGTSIFSTTDPEEVKREIKQDFNQ